jgi:hypothetical protein
MVLVNKDDPSDRAMIIEIRPPDVVDERVLREFSRRGRGDGWWHLPSETCIGEAGQANLLQAQVCCLHCPIAPTPVRDHIS